MKLYVNAVAVMILATSCQDMSTIEQQGKIEEVSKVAEHQNNPAKPIFHSSHEPKKQDAPFSDVVQVGTMYFLSGQIGMDQSKRTLVSGGIKAETKQTLENIKAVLIHHNMDMSNVVKSLVILDDINDFDAFNEIYRTYLPQKPARTTFAAESLAAGAKIEIEVVAVKND